MAQVSPDSAAMAAGILSGDVIKSVDGKNVAAVSPQREDQRGMPPFWLSYVTVDDADAAAAKAAEESHHARRVAAVRVSA